MPYDSYVQYPIVGPMMDASMPPNQVRPGTFPRLVGVDGRFMGCLRKFFGMNLTLDLNTITGMTAELANGGIYFINCVAFQKTDTAITYRGFVIAHRHKTTSTNMQIDLVYTEDDGDTWDWFAVYSDNDVLWDTAIDVAVHRNFLFVCIEGVAPKTVQYQDTTLVVRDMGAGTVFTAAPAAMTALSASLDTTDTYFLNQDGLYQMAYRFYNSSAQLYSALSLPRTARIPASDTYNYGKCSYNVPAAAALAAGFDMIDFYRTIDMSGGKGAIFYLESTLDLAVDFDTEGMGSGYFGTLLDEALPFQTQYNPLTSVVSAIPYTSTIGRYQGITFVGESLNPLTAAATQYDILHSAMESEAAEYFTTYNRRKGSADEGRTLRFFKGADSLFAFSPTGVIHIFKGATGRPLQYNVVQQERGLVGKEAGHTSGTSIFFVSGMGLMIFNAADGTMGQISATDRIILDEWATDLSDVRSGYDAIMNASFFLNPNQAEILCVWASTHSTSLIEGANFNAMTHGPDVTGTGSMRAYFVTDTSLIVVPDAYATGTGTMWGLPTDADGTTYTYNGTVTARGTVSEIIDTGIDLPASCIGSYVYVTNGDCAGESAIISDYTAATHKITTATEFSSILAPGTTFAVCAVPFRVRCWPLTDQSDYPIKPMSKFKRWNIGGMAVKVRNLVGFTDNPNNVMRVGSYRNSSPTLSENTAEITVGLNP